MAKKKEVGGCGCAEAVDKHLAQLGIQLESCLQMNFKTGKARLAKPFISVKWKDKPKKNKRLPLITCPFCPWCGKKTGA